MSSPECNPELEPLLAGKLIVSSSTSPPASSSARALSVASSRASSSSPPSSDTLSADTEASSPPPDGPPSRSVEDDVLPETSTLGRTLNWRSAYILTISRVIGSGIFAAPGAIARSAGSIGLALTLWIVGAVIAACGLSVYLEYGCMLPRSGGDKVYLEFTYRRPRFLASTMVAVSAVLLGFTASNCIVFAEYVLFAFGKEDAGDALRKGLAVALLVGVTIVHGVFPRFGVKLQNFLGWVKIGLVVFMILCGFYVVVVRSVLGGQWHDTTPLSLHGRADSIQVALPKLPWWNSLWAGSNWNWNIIAVSLFKVFYSFAGLENANNVLNEVKDPVRTLKSVTRTALITSSLMYLLVNVAYFAVVPIEDIKTSGELIAALYFERLFGPGAGRLGLSLGVALSAIGNVLVVAFAMSRFKQEVARQGFLPYSEYLSSTKPFGSPLGGLLVHFVPSFLVIVLPPSREVYSFILEVEGYPAQFFALATAAGLLRLRYKRPDLKRPFRAWLPAVVLRIILCLALIAAPFFPPKEKPANGLFYATYAIVGVGILAFGVLYWYLWMKLIPQARGYRLEEKVEVLDDGTSVTKLVHVR